MRSSSICGHLKDLSIVLGQHSDWPYSIFLNGRLFVERNIFHNRWWYFNNKHNQLQVEPVIGNWNQRGEQNEGLSWHHPWINFFPSPGQLSLPWLISLVTGPKDIWAMAILEVELLKTTICRVARVRWDGQSLGQGENVWPIKLNDLNGSSD